MARQSSNKEDKFEGKEEKSRRDPRRPRSEGSVYQRADGCWVAYLALQALANVSAFVYNPFRLLVYLFVEHLLSLPC